MNVLQAVRGRTLGWIVFSVLASSFDFSFDAPQVFAQKTGTGGQTGGVQYQIKRAERLMDQLNYRFAIEHLVRAEKSHPKSGMLRLLRGDCLYSLGQHREAVRAYEEGFEIAPYLRSRAPNYPFCYYRMGEFETAKKHYLHLVEQGPVAKLRGQGYYGLGLCALAKNDVRTAREHFEKAVVAMPDAKKVHYRLGLLAARAKNYDRAIRHFETVIERDGMHEAALMQLALALKRSGKKERALQIKNRHLEARLAKRELRNFRAALEKNPGNLVALRGVADLHFRFGNHFEALGPYKALVVAAQNDAARRYPLAVCLAMTGEPHLARLQLERIEKELPSHEQAARLLKRLRAHFYGPDDKPGTGDEATTEFKLE